MKKLLIFISLFLITICTINAQSVTTNQVNGRLQMTTVSNVSDSTWSITGYFTNSVGKYLPSDVAVNDKFFCQIGANTYVGRISVINSRSDATKLMTFRVICNYPSPPNNIGAIVRATSNGYPVYVDGLPNALQAGIQNHFATLVDSKSVPNPCEQTITKTSHGFRKWTPIRWNGSTYVRPTNDTLVPDYIVVDSLTANTFKVANCGTYTTTLSNGLYWFTSQSPGYSLTQDTTKVPLFQVLNGKLLLQPIVGFNLMSGGGAGDVTSEALADTAAAIRATNNGIYSGSGILASAITRPLISPNNKLLFTQLYNGGIDSSYLHFYNSDLDGQRSVIMGITDSNYVGGKAQITLQKVSSANRMDITIAAEDEVGSAQLEVRGSEGISMTAGTGGINVNNTVGIEMSAPTPTILGMLNANREAYHIITSTTSPDTLSSVYSDNLINQGSTQATFTLAMPSSPQDGQVCYITFDNTITALTIDGNGESFVGTVPTTGVSGTRIKFKYYTEIGWIVVGSPSSSGGGSTPERVFLENSTATSVDLDAGTTVKDRDGSNTTFTFPSNLSDLRVHKNGQLLAETGTSTTRDYSCNTSTNVLTFTIALISTDRVIIEK